MQLVHLTLAYFVLNIDPILVSIGPISVHWYGLAYVVAIILGLWGILHFTRHLGIHEDQVWGLFIWTAIAGLIGGRLYFVVQQPDLVQNYLLRPINVFAVWNGGMAFFGAIFVGTLTLFLLAPRYGVNRWIAIDGGALFAAIGQIFGRFGNVVNGDILGKAASNGPISVPASVCAHSPCIAYVSDPHILPWAFVYTNVNNHFVPLGVAYQPAQVYEMLFTIAILAILWPLRYRLPRIRAGYIFTLYLALYAISQFLVFFTRATEPTTPFLGISTLKQAQWTAIFTFILAIVIAFVVTRFSGPYRYSEADPVPWKPASEREQNAPTPPALPSGAEPASQATSVNGAATEASSAPVADLPPWQPTHPTGGQLRNTFGATSQTQTSGEA